VQLELPDTTAHQHPGGTEQVLVALHRREQGNRQQAERRFRGSRRRRKKRGWITLPTISTGSDGTTCSMCRASDESTATTREQDSSVPLHEGFVRARSEMALNVPECSVRTTGVSSARPSYAMLGVVTSND
jgi:hypothetical protein